MSEKKIITHEIAQAVIDNFPDTIAILENNTKAWFAAIGVDVEVRTIIKD